MIEPSNATLSPASPDGHSGSAVLRPLRDGLLPYARRHRRWLMRGLVFTVLLVACRLALPLPLGAAVAQSVPAPALPRDLTYTSSWAHPANLLVVGFVALALLAGMAEYFQRLAFANFASRSINDARSAANARVSSMNADARADLGAHVIADSSRVKQGLKGALNHVVLNALLVLGACAALAFADSSLGLVLLTGVAVLLVVAVVSARQVATIARHHRDSEARLAEVIHRLATAGPSEQIRHDVEALHLLDAAGGRAESDMTRREGLCTWIVHAILAVTAGVVLILGTDAAAAGRLDTAVLAAVVGYLLVLHGPAVRLARQITRLGAVHISAHHLGLVLVRPADAPQSLVADRLGSRLVSGCAEVVSGRGEPSTSNVVRDPSRCPWLGDDNDGPVCPPWPRGGRECVENGEDGVVPGDTVARR